MRVDSVDSISPMLIVISLSILGHHTYAGTYAFTRDIPDVKHVVHLRFVLCLVVVR